MKKQFFLLMIFYTVNYFSQVGINTISPHSSAALEVYSDDMGVTFPNVSLADYTDVSTIHNPKESLIVYNTNNNLYGKKHIKSKKKKYYRKRLRSTRGLNLI